MLSGPAGRRCFKGKGPRRADVRERDIPAYNRAGAVLHRLYIAAPPAVVAVGAEVLVLTAERLAAFNAAAPPIGNSLRLKWRNSASPTEFTERLDADSKGIPRGSVEMLDPTVRCCDCELDGQFVEERPYTVLVARVYGVLGRFVIDNGHGRHNVPPSVGVTLPYLNLDSGS